MRFSAIFIAAAILVPTAAFAESVLSPDAKVRTFIFRKPAKHLDPIKARPMRLPVMSRSLPSELEMAIQAARFRSSGYPAVSQGGNGDGKPTQAQATTFEVSESPVETASARGGGVTSNAYGTTHRPYTLALTPGATVVPYRRAGSILFDRGGGNATTCSGALIKPGIVVTAAHCIAAFGSSTNYTNFVYRPAYGPDSQSSYGVWNVTQASVLSSWSDGTDPCATRGVVCQDDIGVLTLAPQNNAYLGKSTGWFAFGINSYGFNNGQVEVAQVGYSSGYGGSTTMLRTDSQGSIRASSANNTIIGSPLGDGSDGSPWVINLGVNPVVDTSVWNFGFVPTPNVVVGVTSWSSGTSSDKQQAGASPFLSSNITTLVNAACSATPAAC